MIALIIHKFSSLMSVVTDLTSKTIGNIFQYQVKLLSKTLATTIPWLGLWLRYRMLQYCHAMTDYPGSCSSPQKCSQCCPGAVSAIPILIWRHPTHSRVSGATGTPKSYRSLRKKKRRCRMAWTGFGWVDTHCHTFVLEFIHDMTPPK